jgi:long-chain-fatty-acid---luciferin-component ligase
VTHSVRTSENRPESVTALDQLLSEDDLFDRSQADVEHLRAEHLRTAVTHHCLHNLYFDALCKRNDISPDAISDAESLTRIPLLPTALFKHRPLSVLSGGSDSALRTTSSGTQGTISVVPRDNATLMRFFATISVGTRELLGVENSDVRVFNLGPPLDGSQHLWISYVMSGVGVLLDSDFYCTSDNELRLTDLVNDLRQSEGRDRIALVGPPPLLLELANAIADAPVALTADSLVIAIGGWKRRSGEMIEREDFDSIMSSSLSLPDSQVRDAFNMVELNSVVFECGAKQKHCPPWLDVRARDPKTLEPLASGQSGVLAFLDPTAMSYPGFVLSDDFGSVRRFSVCECGRIGDLLDIERRVNRLESRGCALKLDILTEAN